MLTQNEPRHSLVVRYAPIIAALVFGGWAAFVNSEYGLAVLVRTGLGQGVYALFSTWIVSHTVIVTMEFTKKNPATFFLSFAAAFIVMVSIPIAIHGVLGTPEVLAAIAPGVVWGSFYIGGYIWVIARSRGGQEDRRQARKPDQRQKP